MFYQGEAVNVLQGTETVPVTARLRILSDYYRVLPRF